MPRYPLNLPNDLKRESEQLAKAQGVSLNQFIMWAVAEKVGMLRASLDDPRHPHVTYRRGASDVPTPVVRGTGVRVATLVVAASVWGAAPETLAEEFDLSAEQVMDALAFYEDHRDEIDAIIEREAVMERRREQAETAS